MTAALGLTIIVLDYISNAILGSWMDSHAVFHGPNDDLQFVIAFLGLVLLVGGCVAGAAIEGSLRASKPSKRARN